MATLQQSCPRPRARSRAALVACLAACLAACLVLALATVGAPAEAAGRKGAGSKSVLKKNKLYKVAPMAAAGCPGASAIPLDTTADLQAYYASVLACLDAAWAPTLKPLKKAGVRFKAPKLAVYSGRVKTPCRPAALISFYCPVNKKIYMYADEITRPWNSGTDPVLRANVKLAATHTLAHEYGHHVQQLTGIFPAISRRYRGAVERRSELQASCLADVFLSAQRAAYPISAESAAHPEFWRYIVVANHGSQVSQQRWTESGYATAQPGACNTFRAPAALVG
jgi:predicted metalloprotease